MTFQGQEVVINPLCVEKVVAVRTVVRTRTERLFSWPWRPLVRMKQVQTITHQPTCYQMNGKLIMHPNFYRDLVKVVTP